VIWLAILLLVVFSSASWFMGRRRATAKGEAAGGRPHSRPNQHAAYVAIWTLLPAFLVLAIIGTLGDRIEKAILASSPAPVVAALDADRQSVFVNDAVSIAHGKPPSAIAYEGPLKEALDQAVARVRDLDMLITWGGTALALVLALILGLLALTRLKPEFRARNKVEGWISGTLLICSAIAMLTTVGIIFSLLYESIRFFSVVPPLEFLTGLHWSPQTALREDQAGGTGAFGAVPLFVGTVLVMLIAMVVAGPVGLYSAIYLTEYSGPVMRAWVKPILEILAGIPTVVFGFFAALTVGPAFAWFFKKIGELLVGGPLDSWGQYLVQVQPNMALAAGVVMGIMLIPFISSLSDDILNAVPQSLRDGSYAMGATKSETVRKVVLPAALPGVAGAFILAVSRAIGETMIVLLALGAGGGSELNFNPLQAVSTVTVQIVTLLTGDQEFDRPTTLAAFGLGMTLFVVTLILNMIALRIVQAYREQYD